MGSNADELHQTLAGPLGACELGLVGDLRLGQLRGPCGVLRTSPRRLFPFKTTPGKWLLQYDTRPLYTRGTTASTFLWVAQRITIES